MQSKLASSYLSKHSHETEAKPMVFVCSVESSICEICLMVAIHFILEAKIFIGLMFSFFSLLLFIFGFAFLFYPKEIRRVS